MKVSKVKMVYNVMTTFLKLNSFDLFFKNQKLNF